MSTSAGKRVVCPSGHTRQILELANTQRLPGRHSHDPQPRLGPQKAVECALPSRHRPRVQTAANVVQGDSPVGDATWFCVRRNGTAKREGWTSVPLNACLNAVGAHSDEVVEVCVARDFRPVPSARLSRVFSNRVRGLVGMELTCGNESLRLAPSHMIASNLGFARAIERFLQQRNASTDDLPVNGALRAFSAKQFLIPCKGEAERIELFRGSTLVAPIPPGDTSCAAEALADGIAGWMLSNLAADGKLPYKYWPSRGAESPADNAIRRFLASLSLARFGELRGDGEIREAARRNLRFNLTRYFRNIGGGRGAIVEQTGAKLGAAAVAGLAILESPASAEFLPELTMLAAGVDSLAGDEAGFRTFFFPPERDGDNWNFYSGEALLFWAEAMRRGAGVAPSLTRWAAAFARCRERHYRSRNPAFVPWHTQACASMFEQTGRREFADFALEISDWLLPMQQWDRPADLPEDLRGRFYNPQHPEFGPPHAASTGAYLEGLADALALARRIGDRTRADAYQRVIARGLRSLRQLQFRDWRDMFYVSKRHRVLGALRTEAYDNALRIDSAGHALAAAVKLLRSDGQSTGGRT